MERSEIILEPSQIRLEENKNELLGIHGVAAHWGERVSVPKLRFKMAEITGKKLTDLNDPGFSHIYRSSYNLTLEQAVAEEVLSVNKMLDTLFKNSGWNPAEVDCFALGCGTPPVYKYGKELADANGMTAAAIFDEAAACNSVGHLLREIFNRNLDHKKVVVAGVEGMTRLIRDPYDLTQADPVSMMTFGNAAAAVNIIPGENLRLITSLNGEYRDTQRNLAATSTYDFDEQGPMFQIEETNNGFMEKCWLPKPDRGRIDMRTNGTTREFLRLLDEMVPQIVGDYKKIDDRPIKFIVSHHPSFGMILLLKRHLERSGINIEIPWVVDDGNSSGATSLVALVRLLDRLLPGDVFMYLSFGAGITATALIFEAGKLSK